MANPICPKTGAPILRDVRPMTVTYKGESITFDMPGWYCDQSKESIHTGEDMKVSDRMLNRLKARSEGLLFRRRFGGFVKNFAFLKKPPGC